MARFRISSNQEPQPETPVLLFRDLRKHRSIKFLWGHQEKLLDQYHAKHLDTPDLAIELPTGSGKTLVGLLIAEFRRRVRGERVVFLCPNRQLCAQVEAQANKYGVPVALLVGKQRDYDPAVFSKYQEAKAVAISTYSGLFNTNPRIDDPECILCDDAHAGDGFVASLWSLKVNRSDHPNVYSALAASLRDAIPDGLHQAIDSYEGNPKDKSAVELVSPIAAADYYEAMRESVSAAIGDTDLKYPWRMISGNLEACQIYVTSDAFEIRPVVPPTLIHRPFSQAKQRIYMSATLGENGDIERSFGVGKIARIPLPEGWEKRGTGRRLVVLPNKSGAKPIDVLHGVIGLTERSLVLVPSDVSRGKAQEFLPEGYSVMGPKEIEADLKVFTQATKTALLLANRYDGIDLPGTDCRMLIVMGVPTGIGLQERYLTERLNANAQFRDRIRTRLTQAVGRCTRDESDFSVAVLLGDDLLKWCCTSSNTKGLHPELQAEIKFGLENSDERTAEDIVDLCREFLNQTDDWHEADLEIVSQRNRLSKQPDATTKVLAKVAPQEIDYLYRLWNGQYEDAFSMAVKITEALSGGDELKPYRSFWHHQAAAAAYLGSRVGKKAALKSSVTAQLTKAIGTSAGIRWLSHLHAKLSGIPEAKDDQLPVQERFLSLNSCLETMGITGTKFQKQITSARTLIESANWKKFEQGLEVTGRLLGATATRFTGEGEPDGLWVFGDWHAFVFEAKTDEKELPGVSLRTVRQAKSHEQTARSMKLLAPYTPCSTIIVSPRTALHRLAVPHAAGLFYLSPSDVVGLFERAASAFGEVRTTAAECSLEVLRDNFTTTYQQEGLALPSLKKSLERVKLASLPVVG
jgi:hypothetical protein